MRGAPKGRKESYLCRDEGSRKNRVSVPGLPQKSRSDFYGKRSGRRIRSCGKRSAPQTTTPCRDEGSRKNRFRDFCGIWKAVLFIIPYSRPKEKTLAQNFCTFFRENGAARKTQAAGGALRPARRSK